MLARLSLLAASTRKPIIPQRPASHSASAPHHSASAALKASPTRGQDNESLYDYTREIPTFPTLDTFLIYVQGEDVPEKSTRTFKEAQAFMNANKTMHPERKYEVYKAYPLVDELELVWKGSPKTLHIVELHIGKPDGNGQAFFKNQGPKNAALDAQAPHTSPTDNSVPTLR